MMEVRCIREPLMKSSAHTLHCFFAPSLYKAWQPRSIAFAANRRHVRNQRHSSTSSSSQTDQSSPAPALQSSAKEDKARAGLDEIFNQSRNKQAPSVTSYQMSGRSYMNPKINDKLDELFPNQNHAPPATTPLVKETADAYKDFSRQKHLNLQKGGISNLMLNPSSKDGSTIGQGQAASVNPFPGQARTRTKRTVRARPAVGRTIEVNERKNIDLGRALTKLEILLRQNKVKNDSISQRYHERPGLKRKRLKSLRWRQHFRAGFQATVKRVVQMSRQGW